MLDTYKSELTTDSSTRKSYADFISKLVVAWLIVVVVLIIFSSTKFGIARHSFHFQMNFTLDKSVLIALIGGATVALIGLLGTVITYFFTRSKEQITLTEVLFKAMIDDEGEETGEG